jgi:hypothetical protein
MGLDLTKLLLEFPAHNHAASLVNR